MKTIALWIMIVLMFVIMVGCHLPPPPSKNTVAQTDCAPCFDEGCICEDQGGVPNVFFPKIEPGQRPFTLLGDEPSAADALSFTFHSLSTESATGYDAIAVDLNKDGKMDVVTPSLGGNLDWYSHLNAESATRKNITAEAGHIRGLGAADMDNDGDVDLVSASWNTDQVIFHENEGTETFRNHDLVAPDPTPSLDEQNGELDGPQKVLPADINGDGHMDLITASLGDNTIALLLNDGEVFFTYETVTETAEGVRSVAAADLDNDGDLDIVSAATDGNRIDWYENLGDNNFATHIVDSEAYDAFSVATADLNGDGQVDILGAYQNGVRWYENKGNQQFEVHSFSLPFFKGRDVATGDLDNDGDLDFVLVGYTWENENNRGVVHWYENLGDKRFQPHPLADGIEQILYAVDIKDLDGDEDLDLLLASQGGNVSWYENTLSSQ